ncbi:hypothetical protein ACFSUR_02475 [Halalkalibacter alkalisediminis]|uniref:Transposase n=1 Tax=Halalkalibacter alkalisediminis TaxID=935616 RepID=A0ABV6NN63_9BACI
MKRHAGLKKAHSLVELAKHSIGNQQAHDAYKLHLEQWFITSRLREIYNTSKTEEVKQKKNELIKYIKWTDEETIKVYEHYFDEENHRKALDGMLENMAQQEKEYMEQRKNSYKKKPSLKAIELNNQDIELDDEIQELLDGLE